MRLEVLASSEQHGSAVNVGFWDAVSIIWQVITHKGDLSVLVQYANPVIKRVEEDQPEGTRMQLELRGLVIGGTDYAPKLADWLNARWREGYLKSREGMLVPWPEYRNRIAWGSGGTLTLRWVKMFAWAAVIVVVIFIAGVIVYLISPWLSYVRWKLSKAVPEQPRREECEGKTGVARWWCELSDLERALVIGGGTLVVALVGAFAVWYLAQRSIAEAGAPKIVIGGMAGS